MNISRNTARSTLLQIVLFLILLAAALFWQRNNIADLYLSGEINPVGWLLNGVVIALFLLGMLRIISLLLSYSSEHSILERLVESLNDGAHTPTNGLSENALAVSRYKYVQEMARQANQVDQGALASNLSTSEQSRFTLVRYVNSILILLGVFGTVVSLSIALIGASSLLDSPEGANKMGMIIGGMSSALSTTMTAIVCFVIYAYFYLRLNNARAQLLNGIESMTATYLLPNVTHTESSLLNQVGELTIALRQSTEKLTEVQQQFIVAADHLNASVLRQAQSSNGLSEETLQEFKEILRDGFRLPAPNPKTGASVPSDYIPTMAAPEARR